MGALGLSHFGVRTGERVVGFCWTRPVPKVGFNPSPEEAEYQSKTIRYQKELMRLHAYNIRAIIDHWVIYVETRPDGGTKYIENALRKAVKKAGSEGIVLYVNFWRQDEHYLGWRKHKFMKNFIQNTKDRFEPVELIDPLDLPACEDKEAQPGFSPIAHFKWHMRREEDRRNQDIANRNRLVELAAEYGRGYGSIVKIAQRMNAEGRKTTGGKQWRENNTNHTLSKIKKKDQYLE